MKNFESVVFGRGYNSQIRTPNIWVPTRIKFSNGNHVLEDNNSKLGTLVKRIPSKYANKKIIAMQSVRSPLTFRLKFKKFDDSDIL